MLGWMVGCHPLWSELVQALVPAIGASWLIVRQMKRDARKGD